MRSILHGQYYTILILHTHFLSSAYSWTEVSISGNYCQTLYATFLMYVKIEDRTKNTLLQTIYMCNHVC